MEAIRLENFTQQKKSSVEGSLAFQFPPTPPSELRTDLLDCLYDTLDITSNGSPIRPEASPLVAVIGVGYVGTHLVEAFAHHYNVLAFDLSLQRLQTVARDLEGLPISFTSDAARIREASHILISVPTILKDNKSIDTTYLRSAIATIETYARPGSTVVMESSVAVGMTRELVGPLMASKNLKVGMSPEVCTPKIPTTPLFEVF